MPLKVKLSVLVKTDVHHSKRIPVFLNTTDGYKPLLRGIFSVSEKNFYCYVHYRHEVDKNSAFT